MPANATILSTRQTVQLLGGTQLEDVWEVSIETIPSQVFAVFRRPVNQIQANLLPLDADQLGQELELVAAHAFVVDVAYRQGVTPAGALTDLYDIYVTSTSGLSSGIVTVKESALDYPRAPNVLPLIDAERAFLDALEAS
jgi:hypothetical protein